MTDQAEIRTMADDSAVRDDAALVDACPDGLLVLVDGRVAFANPAAHRLLGADVEGLMGTRLADLLDEAGRRAFAVRAPGPLSLHLEGHALPLSATLAAATWRGATAEVLTLRLAPVPPPSGAVRATGHLLDLLAHNRAAQLLIEPEDGRIVDASPAAAAFYGYDLAQLRTLTVHDLNALPRHLVREEMARAQREERTYFLFPHRLASGELRTVEVYTGPVTVDGHTYLHSILHDITDRMEAEARLTAAVAQGRVLLREVHHRVKNNLQVVSSLLSLQAGRHPDPVVREVFAESQVRIRAMALLHELLHHGEDGGRLDLAAYLEALTRHLYRAYGVDPDRVVPELALDAVDLDLDAAHPCGLLVTELASNALKYAFPGDRAGTLTVRLAAAGDGQAALTVADDGVGLPAGLDYRHSEGLGFQLVLALTDQLGGRIDLSPHPGTRFTIRFRTSR